MPYPDNHLMLRNISPYATERLIIAAPPTMKIAGSGIAPAGQDQGFNVYTMDHVAANAPVDITVSGTAPLPPNSADAPPGGGPAGGGDNSQNPSVNSRAADGGGAGDAASVTATAIPARLDSLKWVLTGGFASIFVLGFVYLWMRPQATGTQIAAPAMAAAAVAPKPAARPSVATTNAVANVADVHREVSGSMDELKDRMFRLELRHQAGTIAEDEYQQERARLEQTIRGLVQG
jgi:hypothetical protein